MVGNPLAMLNYLHYFLDNRDMIYEACVWLGLRASSEAYREGGQWIQAPYRLKTVSLHLGPRCFIYSRNFDVIVGIKSTKYKRILVSYMKFVDNEHGKSVSVFYVDLTSPMLIIHVVMSNWWADTITIQCICLPIKSNLSIHHEVHNIIQL